MSTSTNAGKVMLGADGCPLRGHDGRIVLSDNLYPMRPDWTLTNWGRRGTANITYGAVNNPVWGETWETPSSGFGSGLSFSHRAWQEEDVLVGTLWVSEQGVSKYSFSGIDWPRVAKMRVSYLFRAHGNMEAKLVPYKFYYGINSPTEPSGSNKPWEGSGWTLLASFNATTPTVYTYGVLDLVGVTNSFWLAGFADVTAPMFDPVADAALFDSDGFSPTLSATTYFSFGGTYNQTTYASVRFEIVYNLA